MDETTLTPSFEKLFFFLTLSIATAAETSSLKFITKTFKAPEKMLIIVCCNKQNNIDSKNGHGSVSFSCY